MEFGFTPEQLALREEVAQWLTEHAPPAWESRARDGAMSGQAREFRARLASKGWLTLGWPQSFGGAGADTLTQALYNEASTYLGASPPDGSVQQVGPILMAHGSPAQQEQWLPGIRAGQWLWLLLAAEPGADSNLAVWQTQAVRQGDQFLVNGRKVHGGPYADADYSLLLAQTNPDAPPHRGLSLFIVDMDTPGVRVAPAPGLQGVCGGMVGFENVQVPEANLIGEQGQGWYLAAGLPALSIDRSGIERAGAAQRALERLVEMAQGSLGAEGAPLTSQATLRHTLAGLAVRIEVLRGLCYQAAWAQSQGQTPAREASMSRIFGAEVVQQVAVTGAQVAALARSSGREVQWDPMEALAPYLGWNPALDGLTWSSAETHRTRIATRGLGLPTG